MAARLLLLFIIGPIIELFVLIKVGGLIGVVPTVALVLITAVIGSQLVRRQGLAIIDQIKKSQAQGKVPALSMLNGVGLLLAGFFLITPGLVSDTLGFVLLIPGLREKLARFLLARVAVVTPAGQGPFSRDESDPNGPLEGEYTRTSEQSSQSSEDNKLDHDRRSGPE